MKKSELIFSAILVPLDFVMIVAAGLLAYALRFGETVTELRPALYELPLGEFFPLLLAVATFWLVIFALSGLYAIGANRRLVDEVVKIFFACSTGVMAIIVLVFFSRELFSSRFIILAGWLLSFGTVSLGRLAIRGLQRLLLTKGIGMRRIVLIGNGSETDRLLRALCTTPRLGYAVVERFAAFSDDVRKRLEALADVAALDAVLFADHAAPKGTTTELLAFCNDHHVTFQYTADLFEAQAAKLELSTVAGVLVIEVKRTPLDGWGKILKRTFDLMGASIAFLVTLPILLVAVAAVKLDSPGPAFVGLARIGQGGKPFTLYKIRSMVRNAQALKEQLKQYNERGDGPLFKMRDDPRITRVGKFIRKWSVDELPQFLNVLQSSMSLVGPRPHEPEEVSHYASHHRTLLAIKPGITGMAQISGRSDLSFADEARLDTYYVENWSLKLDLHILFKTPRVVLSAKSAA